ncbi:MAG TPA: pitrilysin family protein [Sedimentisphaerales bacterium]|nr:insulinase family protein [Phycisphaerae bacterium]HON90043.1 pitrilysin family protein [Sedimentisphaerales bacterium]HQI27092.1 pitrilysin family protein [Sedimentisphaerales bacterium]
MRTTETSMTIAAAVLALAVGAAGATTKQAPDHRKLKYPPLREVKVPEVTRVTLPNGMKLLLLEDHELPLIHLSARIRTGSIYEPAEKIGLADITGEVMRTGGTPTMTGDKIDEALEAMAASVEIGIGLDYGMASLSVLKEDLDKTLGILADILMNPAFPQNKIELAKIQHRSAIARRNDEPDGIASREFAKLIYGPDSVYARHTEYATIDAITRDDLVAFHKRFFGPNAMMAAVWGDFETREMIHKIEKAFGGWAKIDATVPPMPKVDYEYTRTVCVVPRSDLNQSNILLGHLGGLRNDPDYFALVVMNQILGGGFTGRLFKNVRSRQGLAYSVFGSYGADYAHPGVFSLGCQTKSESTVQAIQSILSEIEKIRRTEVSDEELKLAKESFLNSFVFNFDSAGEIVTRLLTYEYYGYPADFLLQTRDRVETVTKADILRVAKKHLNPTQVHILVVGNPEGFDKPLSTLGDVETLDVTIPSPSLDSGLDDRS